MGEISFDLFVGEDEIKELRDGRGGLGVALDCWDECEDGGADGVEGDADAAGLPLRFDFDYRGCRRRGGGGGCGRRRGGWRFFRDPRVCTEDAAGSGVGEFCEAEEEVRDNISDSARCLSTSSLGCIEEEGVEVRIGGGGAEEREEECGVSDNER